MFQSSIYTFIWNNPQEHTFAVNFGFVDIIPWIFQDCSESVINHYLERRYFRVFFFLTSTFH